MKMASSQQAKRAKSTKIITGSGFKHPRDLTLKEVKRLEVSSFNRVTDSILPGLGWKGGLYGLIGLQLTNDNRSITTGNFFMVGQLFQDSDTKVFQAAKFWAGPDTADIDLHISVPSAEIFTFKSSMVSDLIDSREVSHAFFRGSQRIEEDEAEALVPGFSLRLFVIPTRENYAKVTLVLYPLSLENLLDLHPLAEDPNFPGLSLCSGEFPIGLPQSQPPRPPAPWGSPILPVVIPGIPFLDCPNVPSGAEFRNKMAFVLRSVTRPDIKNGPASLTKRWIELQSAGASKLAHKAVDKLWPLPPPTAPLG